MSDEYNELLQQDAAPAARASQQKRPFRKKRKRGGTDVHSGFNDVGKNKAKKRGAAADTDGDPESGAVDDQPGKRGSAKVWSKDGDGNDEKREVSEEERAIQLSEFQVRWGRGNEGKEAKGQRGRWRSMFGVPHREC